MSSPKVTMTHEDEIDYLKFLKRQGYGRAGFPR
jgi:hypothetical protein